MLKVFLFKLTFYICLKFKTKNKTAMECIKKFYFSVNQSKFENEEKLNNQLNNVINFISNRHCKNFKKTTLFMGYNGSDFFYGKMTLEITFYL